jgi:hypothetical protein
LDVNICEICEKLGLSDSWRGVSPEFLVSSELASDETHDHWRLFISQTAGILEKKQLNLTYGFF